MKDLSTLVWANDSTEAGLAPEFLIVDAAPTAADGTPASLAVNELTGALYAKSATGWVAASGGGGTSFANPTASVGPAATNGVAITAMRSDAAPALANTAVTPGSYTHSAITVDAQGRLTAASSGTAPPAAANPTASVGPAAVNGAATTFMRSDAAPALANTAVAAGSYTYSAITVDAQGRLTAAANGAAIAGRLIGFQVLTGAGTYTPTAGTASFIVDGSGAGGGGGGIVGTALTTVVSAGGGGGARFYKRYTSLAASYPFSCGAAGAAGAAGNNAGGAGGNTTFDSGGTLLTAPGGLGATGANALVTDSRPGIGGAVATGATINLTGQSGGQTVSSLDAGAFVGSGAGASAIYGGGGIYRIAAGAGNDGTGFGSGGGGALSTDATNRAGGAGAPGGILVWEYS